MLSSAKIIIDDDGNQRFSISESKALQIVTIDFCKQHPDICFNFNKDEGKLNKLLFGKSNYTHGEGYVRDGIAIIGQILKVMREDPIVTKVVKGKYITKGGKIMKKVSVVLTSGTKIYYNPKWENSILIGTHYYYDKTTKGYELFTTKVIDNAIF